MTNKTCFDTPIGRLSLSECDGRIISLLPSPGVEDSKGEESEALINARRWIYNYFADRRPSPSEIHVAPSTSAFSMAVLSEVMRVPYGAVISVSQLRDRVCLLLSKERLPVCTVWSVLERNPLPIFIPCHRVVGDRGELHSYVLGIENKAHLLRLESMRNIFGTSRLSV